MVALGEAHEAAPDQRTALEVEQLARRQWPSPPPRFAVGLREIGQIDERERQVDVGANDLVRHAAHRFERGAPGIVAAEDQVERRPQRVDVTRSGPLHRDRFVVERFVGSHLARQPDLFLPPRERNADAGLGCEQRRFARAGLPGRGVRGARPWPVRARSSAPVASELEQQHVEPAQAEIGPPGELPIGVEMKARQASRQGLEHELTLDARERRAEAEVGGPRKGDVAIVRSSQVETIRVGEALRVTVGCSMTAMTAWRLWICLPPSSMSSKARRAVCWLGAS